MTARHPLADLFEDTPDQVIRDYEKVRKAKRLPITATAMAMVKREAEKAGISLCKAVTTCAEQGWAGFKARWYANLMAEEKAAEMALTARPGESAYQFQARTAAARDNGGVAPAIRQSRVIEPLPERGKMPAGLDLRALVKRMPQ